MIRAGLGGAACEQPSGADHALQFVHVADVADGLIAAFDADRPPRPVYNLVAGPRVTVGELAGLVRTHLPDATIEIGPGELPGEAPQAEISSAAISADLGWTPKIALTDGILAYIAWLRANPF
jgi:nucleoside-diphosphate-sugar epimerase